MEINDEVKKCEREIRKAFRKQFNAPDLKMLRSVLHGWASNFRTQLENEDIEYNSNEMHQLICSYVFIEEFLNFIKEVENKFNV